MIRLEFVEVQFAQFLFGVHAVASLSLSLVSHPRVNENSVISRMATSNSTLALGDSVHEALLPPNDPTRRYEEETEAVLRRKEHQIDAKSHKRKLYGWLSYAFAR